MTTTILDTLLSEYSIKLDLQPISIAEDDIVHVVGAQEPVRDQPDERARVLFRQGWLTVESIQTTLSESDRLALVTQVQEAAKNQLKQLPKSRNDSDRQQVRWLFEKTRPHESKQQIAQRVWLAIVLHGQNCRGLHFDANGQIRWNEGIAGRIGISPDELFATVLSYGSYTIYTASFRAPDGTIMRGKGRNRWHVYRLVIDPQASQLFQIRKNKVTEKIALIVASESYATQPQLPRDFYGGDAFQQACIDAQDQHFEHILVLSPEHGILSLDDTVPSDKAWDDVLEQHIWPWQMQAIQRLGHYLLSSQIPSFASTRKDLNGWLWLNPESTYRFTVFGGGFAVRVLFDHLLRARARTPRLWPNILLDEYRPGYIVGDFDDDFDLDFEMDAETNDDMAFELAMQDINQLLEWATDFVNLVTITIPPTDEIWEIEPDEALIPMRLLADTDLDIDNLLDLLADITLLLEQPVPLSLIINPGLAVSTLLQLTHNLVHNEHDLVQDVLNLLPESALRQYVENALQEPRQEDRLCACLTLAEQIQIIDLTISSQASEQLLVWMQTYISTHIRQQLLGGEKPSP